MCNTAYTRAKSLGIQAFQEHVRISLHVVFGKQAGSLFQGGQRWTHMQHGRAGMGERSESIHVARSYKPENPMHVCLLTETPFSYSYDPLMLAEIRSWVLKAFGSSDLVFSAFIVAMSFLSTSDTLTNAHITKVMLTDMHIHVSNRRCILCMRWVP